MKNGLDLRVDMVKKAKNLGDKIKFYPKRTTCSKCGRYDLPLTKITLNDDKSVYLCKKCKSKLDDFTAIARVANGE